MLERMKTTFASFLIAFLVLLLLSWTQGRDEDIERLQQCDVSEAR